MGTPWERINGGFRDYLKDLGTTADEYNSHDCDRGRLFNAYKALQQQNDKGAFMLQLSETEMEGLKLMAEDHAKRRRTIVLSEATDRAVTDLLNMLDLPERGASWPIKPALSRNVVGFTWVGDREDSLENRTAYMAHLNSMLQLPADYALTDVQPIRQLLSVELFWPLQESRKFAGTTDVAIAKSVHVYNQTVRNNIEIQFELKTPKNMQRKDHTPQTIGEHIAASYLNRRHPIISVLTDLNEKWTLFWFAKGEDDSEMALYKLCLDGEQAATEAKYILDSLYDSSLEDTLPTTLASRLSFEAVFTCIASQHKRLRREFDGDENDSPNQDSKPSPSGGAGGPPRSGSNAGSSSRKGGTAHQTNQGNSGRDGDAPVSMASTLSLFAPPSDRDVANELDLLDMVDENEQYEIVRSFAARHIVPYMRPVE